MNKHLLCVCLLGMVALAAAVDAEPQKKYYKKDEYEKKYDHEYEPYKHDEYKHDEYKHEYYGGEKKVVRLYVKSTAYRWSPEIGNPEGTPPFKAAMLGDTAGISGRTLSCANGGPEVAVLYQDGIYTYVTGKIDNTGGPYPRLNWQQSFIIESSCMGLPAGTIFTLGDDTSFADPAFGTRAIVGGTGPYVGARGTVSRPEAATDGPYVITLIDFKGY